MTAVNPIQIHQHAWEHSLCIGARSRTLLIVPPLILICSSSGRLVTMGHVNQYIRRGGLKLNQNDVSQYLLYDPQVTYLWRYGQSHIAPPNVLEWISLQKPWTICQIFIRLHSLRAINLPRV